MPSTTTPDIRIIMRHGVRAYTQAMLASQTADLGDDEKASEAFARLAFCLLEHSRKDARRNLATIKALVFDTQARQEAFFQYDRLRGGTIQEGASMSYSECISE